jgi:hypothetical protein
MRDDAMNDLRRERIAAATSVFERVLAGYEQPSTTAPHNGHPPRTDRVQLAELRTAAARTVDLYAQLLQEALEGLIHFAGDVVPGLGAGGEPPLSLAARRGATVSAPVWIHNYTDASVRGVELRLTGLTAPGGAQLNGSIAAFVPERLEIEGSGSGESQLHLGIPADAVPATYHGHLLASALPASALAVRLEVKP